MAETFLNSGFDRYVPDDVSQPIDSASKGAELAAAIQAAFQRGEIQIDANGPSYSGTLAASDLYNLEPVELEAGQTYTWSYRGTEEGGIEDPYLILLDTGFGYITEDDDGGYGRTAQITFTATETGTYYLLASSYYQLATATPESGDYTITQWSPDAALDAPGDLSTTFSLSVGTNYAYVDSEGDVDIYSFDVSAGQLYSFSYSGGVWGAGDWDGEPGENISTLLLLDAEGNTIGSNLNYESGLSYFAEEDATIYVATVPFDGTGGYTIDVQALDPADYDPLESLNWDSAANIPTVDVDGVPTAYVYFADAGENFGETGDDGGPMITFGWQQYQIDAVMHGLQNQYTPITGINYVITDDVDQATFRLLTTESTQYGAYFYPQAPNYGDAAGIGVFNLRSGGFGTDPASLDPGGFSYAVVLHEFGHAHGVAHPHDTGGGSEVMLAVTSSASLGIYDLNQGVYTVMSYNDAWITHPDGERSYSPGTRGDGWSETLGAFDIAVLQARYGTHDFNDGNTVYQLTDVQEEASYKTIWDTSGTDEIAYSGELDVRIDLLAATLDYTPTGGGVVSFVDGVFGGYTIANGVVIENATGGEGNDILIGNDAANVLTGNDGNDVLMGRDGDDLLLGGNDEDQLHGDGGNDELHGGNAKDYLSGGDGDDMLFGENGKDILNGGAGDDDLWGGRGNDVFVFDSFEGGVDTVHDYNTKNDSVEIASDGVVSWANGAGGAELSVDGTLVAIFEGKTAGQMAGEWSIIASVDAYESASTMHFDQLMM